MNLPDGFDPDPTEWLETSFAFEAVLECYPDHHADDGDRGHRQLRGSDRGHARRRRHRRVLGLNVYGLPDHTMYVSECPNHQSRQEHYLAT